MGNQQPKKLGAVTKPQIDIACLKAKIHLQLMRDRKNAEIIKGEKQLVNKIKSNTRNKTEEVLLIERIVNGLKYTQACNQLSAYCLSLRPQADFISKNMMFPDKMAPYLTQIYTLIFAADRMGLSSLNQFKSIMRALNNPMAVNQYVSPEIMQLLTPNPTPEEMNIYVLEMIERNGLQIQQINRGGHKFTKDYMGPGSKDDSFAQLQKKMAEQMNKPDGNQGWGPGNQGNQGGYGQGGYGNQGGYGPGPGGYGGQGGYGQGGQGGYGGYGGQGGQGGFGPGGFNQGGLGQGGFGPGGQGSYTPPNYGSGNNVPGYYDLDKNTPVPYPVTNRDSQMSNPYGIRQSYNPNQPKSDEFPKDQKINQPNNMYNDSRISINSLQDIAYFPELDGPKKADPQFDQICEILRAAM